MIKTTFNIQFYSLVVTAEILDEDNLIFDAKLARVGTVRKNQAPDFFHN